MPNAKPNELDIAGLRELEKKATGGLWQEYFDPDSNDMGPVYSVKSGCYGHLFAMPSQRQQCISDAKFIAAIRNAAVELIALAEIGQAAVEAEVANVKDEYTQYEWLLAEEKRDDLAEAYLARKDGGK